MGFVLAQDAPADAVLDSSTLALLIAMVLDQQIPMERAFRGPYVLRERLGKDLDASEISTMDPELLEAAFTAKPAIHRFPSAMAKRVAATCSVVATNYDGDAARIWEDATDGAHLFARINALPGFGPDKTRIFIALLGKQIGLTVHGWREVAHPFGEPGTFMSVADIVDSNSLDSVRAFKAEMKRRHKENAPG